MRMFQGSNPFFPDKKTYRCDIGHHSVVGDYDEVFEWRSDRLKNSDYYRSLEELRSKATAEFLSKDKGNKGD